MTSSGSPSSHASDAAVLLGSSLAFALLLGLVLATPATAGHDLLQPMPEVPLDDVQPVRLAGMSISLNSMVGRSSDYRDPNWDWTVNTTYDLRTHSETFYGVRLPYYSSGGPAARDLNVAGARDIYPEDGWVLVLRDFGPVAVPYYILYNRYRGILRFFYYSTLPQTFSRVVGSLSFQTATTSASAGFFTLLDDQDVYYDTYDPSRNQIAIGQVEWQRWAYLDFDVSGYDPNIGSKDDPTLTLSITGVTTTNLVASGSLDLTTMTVNSTDGSGGGLFNSASSLYKNVVKRDKQVSDFKSWVTKKADDNPTQWWAAPLQAIKSLTETSWFGALGPVAGFLDFVIGGGSSSSDPPAPMSTRGSVDLEGELTTEGALYSLILRVPGSNHVTPATDADSNILPLYDLPLGVFNVLSKPSYDVNLESDTTQIDPVGPWTVKVDSHATDPMQVTWNTHVFSSVDVRATWAPETREAEGYTSLSSFNSGWSRTWYDGQGVEYSDLFYGDPWHQVGVRVRLTPSDTNVEPTTLYKTYWVNSNVTRTYDTSGGGGCCEF